MPVVVTNPHRSQVLIGPRVDMGADGVRSFRFMPGRNEVDDAYWAEAKKAPIIARALERKRLVEGESEKPKPQKVTVSAPAQPQVSRATQVGQAARDAARGKKNDGEG